MPANDQSLPYKTPLKIKQELIENVENQSMATERDMDMLPAAKASNSILEHQPAAAFPINMDPSLTAKKYSTPKQIMSEKAQLESTGSAVVESSPKSTECKTILSVERVSPRTPIKECRPSADVLRSASGTSQSLVYNKVPRSPPDNVPQNASSKRSVPKSARRKSSKPLSKDQSPSISIKTARRVSPRTPASTLSVTARSRSPYKTPARSASAKTPKLTSKLTRASKSVVGSQSRMTPSILNHSSKSSTKTLGSGKIQCQADVKKTPSLTQSSDLSMPLLVSAHSPSSSKNLRSDVTPRYA